MKNCCLIATIVSNVVGVVCLWIGIVYYSNITLSMGRVALVGEDVKNYAPVTVRTYEENNFYHDVKTYVT